MLAICSIPAYLYLSFNFLIVYQIFPSSKFTLDSVSKALVSTYAEAKRNHREASELK